MSWNCFHPHQPTQRHSRAARHLNEQEKHQNHTHRTHKPKIYIFLHCDRIFCSNLFVTQFLPDAKWCNIYVHPYFGFIRITMTITNSPVNLFAHSHSWHLQLLIIRRAPHRTLVHVPQLFHHIYSHAHSYGPCLCMSFSSRVCLLCLSSMNVCVCVCGRFVYS